MIKSGKPTGNSSKIFISMESLRCYENKIKEFSDKEFENWKVKNTNCPNCGAVIESDVCPYCNTNFKRYIYG